MVIKPTLQDREMNKFEETPDGLHAVRTIPYSMSAPPPFADYVGVTYPDNVTEVYTYRVGGSSGSIVRVVTVVYSNSSKSELASITWS